MFKDEYKSTISIRIDAYSKDLWIRTIKEDRTEHILRMLEDIMYRFDTSIGYIRSKMGKEFKSKDYVNFLCKNNIKLEYELQYEHCKNGEVERVIRTIRNLITKLH
uniref:Integrase catalytic domain-containing protein n=1 Tax=Strongyloides venezuelensis TaxID=75913 RepID=A0A0K0F174_STRVS